MAVSLVVHAAIVSIAILLDDDDAPSLHESSTPRVELIDVMPLEVTMLLPDELARLETRARSRAATPPRTEDRPQLSPPKTGDRPQVPLATSVTRGRSTTEVAPTIDAPATDAPMTGRERNPMFDMRRGKLDLAIADASNGDGGFDRAAPSNTGAKPDVPATGTLQPDGGGKGRHDGGVFHAKIAKDGSVTLRDGANLTSPLLAHRGELLRSLGNHITEWYRDDNKPVGTLGPPNPAPEERIALIEAVPGGNPISGGGVTVAEFDATDALMRRVGMDPYASRKLAFLDSTRDERVAMGERYRSEQLAQASRIMKGNLDRLASLSDLAVRKRALFELWDECLETGSEAEVTAGRESRALVIGYIRAHLPAGSTSAYTPEDLAELDARRTSTAVFAPYE